MKQNKTIETIASKFLPKSGETVTGDEQISKQAIEIINPISSVELIKQIISNYPEMKWLTGDVNASPENNSIEKKENTIGEDIFNNLDKSKLIEFNRTAVGILILQWILKGDYDSFTACQKEEVKLTKQNFLELQNYTKSIIKDEEAVDAMITYMVINDLTKIKSIINKIEEEYNIVDIDHDKLLIKALNENPEISPSFNRLSDKYKNLILNGLKAEFNIGQFIQAENIPANLSKLEGIDKDSLDFYLLHAICDIAGAAGQFVQNGSAVMTNSTYTGFKQGVQALEKLNNGASEIEVYDKYLELRADKLNLNINNKTEKAITRVCCMLRYFTPEKGEFVKNVFDNLPKNTKIILENELNKNGINDGFATLIYYSPALLGNLQTNMENKEEALELGLLTLARIYQEARINLKTREGNGVYTVMASSLATLATKNPEEINNKQFEFKEVGDDAEIILKDFHKIDLNNFYKIDSLEQIPGNTILPVGIGGGSDGVQAAQLGELLKQSGKNVPAVISVRQGKTESQGINGKIGEDRTPKNATEIYEGIYIINSETKMKGRALEPLIAKDIPTYLILIKNSIKVEEQIEFIKNHLGNIDTIIGVDTGGDALYSTNGQDNAKATPDQDILVLKALNKVKGVNTLSAEIALGVDTPEDGEEKLKKAEAVYFEPNENQTKQILKNYKKWQLDGNNDKYFGKTPLAWQQALKNNFGMASLNLPTRVVTDPKNPWNNFVNIQKSTKAIFFMETEKHLETIFPKKSVKIISYTIDGDPIKGPDFDKYCDKNGGVYTLDGDYLKSKPGTNLLSKH